MKKIKKKSSNKTHLYKISKKIDGFTHFTILTENQKNGEGLTYSPNKEYFFSIGNKINKDVLVSCVLSIRLEDYEIIDARELPEMKKIGMAIQKRDEDFKEIVNELIKNNPELYEDLELEK